MTWVKKASAALMGLAIAFALNSGEAAPMRVEHQIDILAQTDRDEGGWFVEPAQDAEWEKWCYAVTDLDHDGNLEILKAKSGWEDSAPQIQCEELLERKWERHFGLYFAGGTDVPDILTGETAGQPRLLHDVEENLYFYIFADTRMHGEYESVTKQYAICLNGDLMVEELAFMTWELSGKDGSVRTRYYLPGWQRMEAESDAPEPLPQKISRQRYANIAKERFPHAVEESAQIKWWTAKELWPYVQRGKLYNLLWESYAVFTQAHTHK